MSKKTSGFTIKEVDLATALGITHQELANIVQFFDSDPNDEWELRENEHFVYLNKSLDVRLFSEQGAYAIAKYLDETTPKSLWSQITEFITHHKQKIRNAFISQKIQENCSSLTVKNNRHFLSKKDVVSILCTSPARLNKAFEEIQRSPNPMKIYEDFDDIEGVRYYSLSGFYKLSQHLAKSLTVKNRRSWCEAIEVVGNKTFKLIISAQAAFAQRVQSAKNAVKKKDKCCQITGQKKTKFTPNVNLAVHHIYCQKEYPHLAACQDNLITLAQNVHIDFHNWNGGSSKPCTADHLIKFVNELYPDNYEVVMRLNNAKQILGPSLKK